MRYHVYIFQGLIPSCRTYQHFLCFAPFVFLGSIVCWILCFLYISIDTVCLILKGAVSRQSSSFCFIFLQLASIAMKLKVSKEITCKWQNLRNKTNKYVSWALFLTLQAAGINFEKLLGWTLKNPNFNPFQSSSVLPICGICCFCYVILTFL